MDYREPDFLAVIYFGSFPLPPLPSVSSTGDTEKERQLADGSGGGGGGGVGEGAQSKVALKYTNPGPIFSSPYPDTIICGAFSNNNHPLPYFIIFGTVLYRSVQSP